MSDIYPAENSWLGETVWAAIYVKPFFSLPGSEWEKENYPNLIEQWMKKVLTTLPACVAAVGSGDWLDNGWYTLRIGQLKAMLAPAGGDWNRLWSGPNGTMEFNSSVFSPERANDYRCLQTLLLLAQEDIASRCNI
ncbi:hypothetical protein ACNKHX_05625 [Shigella flexneri]